MARRPMIAEWYQEDAQDLRNKVGAIIARRREASGKTLTELMVEDGVSGGLLGRVIVGTKVDLETYARVAEAFGLTLKELLIEACGEGT